MKISLEHSKFLWIISAIFRSPAKSVRKDAWNSQSSLDYSGNLAVTITTDTKISLEHSKFLWPISTIFRSPAKLVPKKLLAQPQFL